MGNEHLLDRDLGLVAKGTYCQHSVSKILVKLLFLNGNSQFKVLWKAEIEINLLLVYLSCDHRFIC